MGEPKKQLCTIRIMFPVISDEEAIEYKKKLTEILSPIANAQIQFSLTTSFGEGVGIPQVR